jgi:hypothetical protein
MSYYSNIVSSLRKTGGPLTLEEVISLIKNYFYTESIKTTSYTLLASDQGDRIVASTGCALITVPALGTLGTGFEVTIVNDSGGQLTINGPGSTNVIVEDGDIVVVMETNSKQRVASGFSTVIS